MKALAAQDGAPHFEIIVPVDQSVQGVFALRQAFPNVRFVKAKCDGKLIASPDIGISHLAIDRRRAAGLAEARGDIVALTEEHARPSRDWCARIIECHRAPHAVIGGAIENARPRPLNWALFFMDAGRYQNPLPEGPSRFASDVNVSYKRVYLDSIRSLWEVMYNETGVHDAIRAAGGTVWLTPKLVVWQDRGKLDLGKALRERFAWARLYAGRRSQGVSGKIRCALALGSPILALLLPLRAGRTTFSRGRHRGEFLKVSPILLLMSGVWAIGELTGYLTGRATVGPKVSGQESVSVD